MKKLLIVLMAAIICFGTACVAEDASVGASPEALRSRLEDVGFYVQAGRSGESPRRLFRDAMQRHPRKRMPIPTSAQAPGRWRPSGRKNDPTASIATGSARASG